MISFDNPSQDMIPVQPNTTPVIIIYDDLDIYKNSNPQIDPVDSCNVSIKVDMPYIFFCKYAYVGGICMQFGVRSLRLYFWVVWHQPDFKKLKNWKRKQ